MSDPKILLIDDDPEILRLFSWVCTEWGYKAICAKDGDAGLAEIRKQLPDLIITDLRMPVIDGFEILRTVRTLAPEIPIIVVSGAGMISDAILAMKLGAYDYVTKPIRNMEELELITRRALAEIDLRREISALRQRVLSGELESGNAFSHIVTRNLGMRRIFSYIEAVAPSNQSVLVTGQTGTGKELIARAVHAASGRRGAFVAVNVAGLDDQSFADTLFGHVRGAFTGADRPREGLIVQAAGGTLFLDEIGELEERSQIKLLRLLQEHEYYPLGSDKPGRSTARVVAATNRAVKVLADSGRFRQDLYFRLCTHQVHIPPLSERQDDIPLLLEQFVLEATSLLGKPRLALPAELSAYLCAYDFPGNVRELKAMVFDAVAQHGRGAVLSKEHFLTAMGRRTPPVIPPPPATAGPPPIGAADRLPTLKEAEAALIRLAMERAGGNQGVAARYLGITRQGLNKILNREKTRG